MPAEDAGSSYRQGIVWVVGMSAAAAGGAFLHYDQARELPLAAKCIFIGIVVLFLVATWSGVNCLFWQFYKVSEDEKLKKLEEDYSQQKIKNTDYTEKHFHGQREVNRARKWRGWYHGTVLWAFALAVLFSVTLLGFGTFSPSSSKKDDSGSQKVVGQGHERNRYIIVQSAVHRTAYGREAHTLLLDQEKGALWVMTCSKKGIVEFHRVQTLNLNGAPEDPSY
jgi:hypothetical protein